MTSKKPKSDGPAFAKHTIAIKAMGLRADGPTFSVEARTLNGLAVHKQIIGHSGEVPRFSNHHTVSHVLSGSEVFTFRFVRHAEQFCREAPRVADFHQTAKDLCDNTTADQLRQLRIMRDKIEAGTYTPGCKL